jgi:iron(III) transport system ATP-binding protein
MTGAMVNVTNTTGTPGAPAIAVRGITKHFRRVSGSIAVAVDDLSLEVRRGEMVAVVGPSGCGKTTLLRCVAGLEQPSTGEIALAGRTVFSDKGHVFVPPEGRRVGMMFQSYALWPHMTVAQNVGYPLLCRGVPKRDIARPVMAMLEKLGLSGLQGEPPSRLSGGQQQRVALARSLVAQPTVVLFDEPLSNVDAKVREELRLELVRMHKELGFSGLYVTHDQDDAMQVCDRLVVLREGRVEQEGPPAEVYRYPASIYVAEFVGVANRLKGRVVENGGGARVAVETDLGQVVSTEKLSTAATADSDVAVLIRPHHLTIARGRVPEGPNRWTGKIAVRMFRGSWMQYLVSVGAVTLAVWSSDHSLEEGTEVQVAVSPSDVFVRRGASA